MGGWKRCWWRELHQPLSAGNFNLKLRRSGKSSEKFPRLRILCLTATWISCPPLRNEFSKRFSQPWPDFPNQVTSCFRTGGSMPIPKAAVVIPVYTIQRWAQMKIKSNVFILWTSLVLSIVSILNTFSLYTTLAGMREKILTHVVSQIYTVILSLLTHIFWIINQFSFVS